MVGCLFVRAEDRRLAASNRVHLLRAPNDANIDEHASQRARGTGKRNNNHSRVSDLRERQAGAEVLGRRNRELVHAHLEEVGSHLETERNIHRRFRGDQIGGSIETYRVD